MSEEEAFDVAEACPQCGMSRAVVRAGFTYCVECGLRIGGTQPVLEFSDSRQIYKHSMQTTANKKKTLKDFGQIWSTWHAHNMILVGMCSELAACCNEGSIANLADITLRLWSAWLRKNRVAFFSLKPATLPYLPIGFKQRDVGLYFGHKTVKNSKIRTKKLPKNLSQTKAALVKLQYEQYVASQSQMQEETKELDNLQITQKKIKDIQLNITAKRYLNRRLERNKLEEHLKTGFCSNTCRCLVKKLSRDQTLKYCSSNLSIINLYAFLYLSLRLNRQDVFIGDILRWCREERISFGNYDHFFLTDLKMTRSDRLAISNTIVSHTRIRKVATRMSKFLKLKYVPSPHLDVLIRRYLKELELPEDMFHLIHRLMLIPPQSNVFIPETDGFIKNFEGIALSYIIVALKLLFGFDGIVENKISNTVKQINEILSFEKVKKELYVLQFHIELTDVPKDKRIKRLFVINDWIKYIEYRKLCLCQFHYPTLMHYDPDNTDNPELFLHHKKITNKSIATGTKKPTHLIQLTKSLLEEVQDNHIDCEQDFPIFNCSTTPMYSYTRQLLEWSSLYCKTEYSRDILEEDFSKTCVSFMMRPKDITQLLAKKNVDLVLSPYDGNINLKTEKQSSRPERSNRNAFLAPIAEVVQIFDCTKYEFQNVVHKTKVVQTLQQIDHQTGLGKIEMIKLGQPKKGRVKNPVPEWRLEIHKRCERNKLSLNVCYQNYWAKHFSNIDTINSLNFEKELATSFPSSFQWLLKECAAMADMSALDLYRELTILEKQIINIETLHSYAEKS